MRKSKTAKRLLSLALAFCLCLVGGVPFSAWADGDDAILFLDDFSGGALDTAWGNIYGKDHNPMELDSGQQALKYTMVDSDGQLGPARDFSPDEIGSWGGQKITISWKCRSEAAGVGVRLNYTSDENEANIFGGGNGEPILPGQWTEYSVELEFTDLMARKPFNLMFKLPGSPTIVYFKDVTVSGRPSPPEILTEELDKGALTVPYEQKLKATGSTPMQWAVTSGSLPAGLSLSEDGVISGTPAEAGEPVFTVEAKNSIGTQTKEFSICVLVEDNEFILAPTAGKNIGDGNPLYTQRFGADPYGLEYDGRLYVYMTNDTVMFDGDDNIVDNSYGLIRHINVISSDDLVNWTDHGSIPVAGAGHTAPWAGNSWAPSIVYKEIGGKDTFFLYFANSGNGVGVLRGESPVGPWEDPIGKNLVSHGTPNCNSSLVPWCFDPAVFIDDDGTAYLYFGGGVPGNENESPKSARVVQLGDDLVSIVGTPEEIDVPYFFEALDMHKYGDTYYLSYCSNWNGPGGADAPGKAEIAYMVSDSPMGPFTYAGVILKNPGDMFGLIWANNHQATIQFKDKWYLLYHATLVSDAKGIRNALGGQVNYRSTHINEMTVNTDGTIALVEGDRAGAPQLKNLDPYAKTEAETIAWNGGIDTVMEDPSMLNSSNLFVTGIRNGSWIAVSKADFANGAGSFTARVSGLRGGEIELRLDSPEGPVIGALPVAAGTPWAEVTANLTAEAKGVRDLYMIFKGPVNGVDLLDFDWWRFDAGSPADPPGDTPAAAGSEPPAASEAPANGTSETPGDWWLGWLAGIGVMVAGVAVFVVMKRRGTKT